MNHILFKVLQRWSQSCLKRDGDSDSQSQVTEADRDGECETSEVPVKTLTWSDAGSSDESPSISVV